MAQRLIDVTVPEDHTDAVCELLEEDELIGCWKLQDSSRVLVRAVVLAERAEKVLDEIQNRVGSDGNFRAVLLAVEATLPQPSAKEEEEKEQKEEQEKRYRVSREELYAEISDAAKTSPVFLAMTALSAVVAVGGLMRNDLPVIIGAMVIAPLLGPNVALALATTLGDLELGRSALLANAVGMLLVLGVAVAFGAVLHVDPQIPAIAARTNVQPVDIGLALAAGCAGALAYTTGVSGPLIGVMVAVALLPPTVTSGLLLGSGNLATATGALLLVVINVSCINLAGVLTFLLQGVRPRSWWEAERARRATIAAVILWAVVVAILGVSLLFAQSGGHAGG